MPRYSDIDLYLTKNEITNDASLKYDIAAISQSIKNIALTTQGEKLFDSVFGGNLYDLLFQDKLQLDISLLRSQLKARIELKEPRALVQSINISDSNLGYWDIRITYSPVYDQTITRDINLTIGSN